MVVHVPTTMWEDIHAHVLPDILELIVNIVIFIFILTFISIKIKKTLALPVFKT